MSGGELKESANRHLFLRNILNQNSGDKIWIEF